MRNFLLSFLAFVGVFSAQAQHIPDANFAAAIRQQCPTCIDANNDLLPDAATLTSLNVSYRQISDLTGIGGFTNLQYLSCNLNYLTILPTLPNNLVELDCSSNQLTSLPTLPNSLTILECNNTSLTSLPTLPSSLQFLDCASNQFSSLPSLPSNLQILNCYDNQLTSLPSLPSNLQILNCYGNQLTSLPILPNSLIQLFCNDNQLISLSALPNSLTQLDCSRNQLTSLPVLVNNLTILNCNNNQLISLPVLPNSLTQLDCNYNQLITLPILSNSLVFLICSNNQLTMLPALPNTLSWLYCANNQLTILPILPNHLTELKCNNNQLTNLPALPNSLTDLECVNNQLINLPALPNNLTQLFCSNNQLINLPPLLPDSLIYLYCDDNQINCLPTLPATLLSLSTYNTNIACIPNLPPNMIGILPIPPICNPSNNPNGCIMFSQAQGQIYFDLNTSGVFDNGDINVSNQLLTTNSLFAAATNNNGFYSLALDTSTTNTISLPTFYNTNYFTVSPASYTITTNITIQTYPNNDFIISPLGNFDDVEVGILGGLYRPGFDNVFYIGYKNAGTTTISGSLSLDLDTDVSFLSASEPSTQTGQNLSFNFSNLAPFETRTIEILVNVDTSVSLGTAINHTLNGIITNDADLTNNQYISNDIVVGSYDPNDINANKEEICSNYPTELEEDLVYTIRFQNTGTFYAQNVRVEDTLSAFLDISSFQQIAASHNYRLVFDNVFINGEHKILAKWYFDNIMLLDSFTNEPLSHGYIKYKIKPLAAQLANRNEIIASQAHIYFDFNAAINTNIDEVVSNICMGINENAADNSSQSFQILPNPNKGNFSLRFAENVNLENANLYIYNYLGELITQQKLQNNNQNIATNHLPTGTYIVKVQTKNATFVQKMIIE